jgi:hypothetical protein
MVIFLLKRDDSLKVALVCMFLAPLVLLPGRGWSGTFGFLQAIAFMLLMGAIQLRLDKRASRLEVALPISGRQLYVVRVAGKLAMVWMPVVSACVVLLMVRRTAGEPLAMQLAQGGAVLTLAAMLPLSTRLQEAAAPGSVSLALSATVLAIGAATWFFLPPLVHLLVFAAASALVFLWAYEKVPPSFQVSPMEAVEAHRPVGRRLRRPAWWLLWRSAYPWLALGLFTFGIFTGWVLEVSIWPALFVFQAGLLSRDGIRWLQSLPISHRTLLALTLGATVVPFMTGAVIGTWCFRPSLNVSSPTVGGVIPYARHDNSFVSYSATNVPLEYWRLAPGGDVPVIRAPWGETIHPPPIHILGLTFYNPYAAAYNPWWTQAGNTSANRNSERFFEWQYENATQRLYGRRITFSEFYDAMDRASTGSFSRDPMVREVLQMLQTRRQVDRILSLNDPEKTRIDILTLETILFLLLAGVFLRELALWHSLQRRFRFARRLLLFAPIPLFAVNLWFDMYYQFHYGIPVFMPLTHLLFRSVSAMLPQNLVALAAIAALPSLGMYWLLERQFARSEMTGPIALRNRSDISFRQA